MSYVIDFDPTHQVLRVMATGTVDLGERRKPAIDDHLKTGHM